MVRSCILNKMEENMVKAADVLFKLETIFVWIKLLQGHLPGQGDDAKT